MMPKGQPGHHKGCPYRRASSTLSLLASPLCLPLSYCMGSLFSLCLRRKGDFLVGTLKDAVVVVTGAGRGLGSAIAEELGQGGAKIVVNYSKSKGPAEDLVAKLLKIGAPQAVAIQADVADAAQAAKLIEETVKQFGRIDVLVNNAGITLDRSMK